MRKKSKFVTFILSCVPGLGHIYLGLIQRGLVFLVATALIVCSAIFIEMLGIFYMPLTLLFLPFVWLAALVDSLILADKINSAAQEAAGTETAALPELEDSLKTQNRKILAVIFALIPGAGHMYMGQMSKGIKLMAAFLLTLYVSDFLNLSFVLMAAPILWFYSVFDVLHRISDPEKAKEIVYLGESVGRGEFSGKTGKYLGIGLVIIGVIMILEKIVLPELSFLFNGQLAEYLRTVVIAALFIAGGIWLMIGNKCKGDNKQ